MDSYTYISKLNRSLAIEYSLRICENETKYDFIQTTQFGLFCYNYSASEGTVSTCLYNSDPTMRPCILIMKNGTKKQVRHQGTYTIENNCILCIYQHNKKKEDYFCNLDDMEHIQLKNYTILRDQRNTINIIIKGYDKNITKKHLEFLFDFEPNGYILYFENELSMSDKQNSFTPKAVGRMFPDEDKE